MWEFSLDGWRGTAHVMVFDGWKTAKRGGTWVREQARFKKKLKD